MSAHERVSTRGGARRWLARAVQLVASLALLVMIWQIAGGAEAVDLLRNARPGWLAVAVVLLMVLTVLGALRWRLAAAPLGIRLSAAGAIGEYFLAQLVNTTFPGGVLGDVGRAARSRHEAGVVAAAGAIVVERTIGQLAMLAVLSAGFVATLTLTTSINWPRPLLIALAVLLPAAWAITFGVLIGLRARTAGAGRFARAAHGLRRSLRSAPWRQLVLAMAAAACVLGAFACCAVAVGAPLSFAAVIAVVPLVLLAMLIPVAIAGWGVREGAAVALLPIAGLGAAQSLAVSICFGLMGLIAALPGVAAVWARRRARPHDMLAAGPASVPPRSRRPHE